MKRQKLEEKLIDLLNDDLSPEETKEILALIDKAGITKEEIDSISSVSRLIEERPVPEPTVRMDKRFYAMVEDEQRKSLLGEPEVRTARPLLNLLVLPFLRIAAGISLFLLGWFASGWVGKSPVGNNQLATLTGEVKQLKETLVLTMMQQNSSVERIKAVNMISEFDNADSQIMYRLIDILNNDTNDNVRLLALDALIRYSSEPLVREGLIGSIGKQTSPMVQLRLAEIMLLLKEKRAVPEFQKILRDASLNYSVRGKVNEALVVLM